MKKLILCAMLILVFAGCSKSGIPAPDEVAKAFEGNFSAVAEMEYGSGASKAEISKNSMSISINVLSPDELSGLEVEIFDEHAIVAFEGTERRIETEILPEGAPFLLLEELFEELSDTEDFVLCKENGRLFAKNPEFTAELDPENHTLINAVFPEYGVRFDFSKFEFFEGN